MKTLQSTNFHEKDLSRKKDPIEILKGKILSRLDQTSTIAPAIPNIQPILGQISNKKEQNDEDLVTQHTSKEHSLRNILLKDTVISVYCKLIYLIAIIA